MHVDVVMGSNLFGDILFDLGPALTGIQEEAPAALLHACDASLA